MAMPDIVNLLNNSLQNLTTAQKIAMLDDFCAARGYEESSGMTKKEFMNYDININYIKKIIDGYRKEQVVAVVSFERLEIV